MDFGSTQIEPVDPRAFLSAFGIAPSGASLVRPDGYIAWRAKELPANPVEALRKVLKAVAFSDTAIRREDDN